MKKYNYVIARYWSDDSDSLCVYAYGSEVHYGTKQDAESFARVITKRANNGETYKPFYIDAER
jgi:hypothetical protein